MVTDSVEMLDRVQCCDFELFKKVSVSNIMIDQRPEDLGKESHSFLREKSSKNRE